MIIAFISNTLRIYLEPSPWPIPISPLKHFEAVVSVGMTLRYSGNSFQMESFGWGRSPSFRTAFRGVMSRFDCTRNQQPPPNPTPPPLSPPPPSPPPRPLRDPRKVLWCFIMQIITQNALGDPRPPLRCATSPSPPPRYVSLKIPPDSDCPFYPACRHAGSSAYWR